MWRIHMFCGKCGSEVSEMQAFCPNCGNQIKKPEGALQSQSFIENSNARLNQSPIKKKNTTRLIVGIIIAVIVILGGSVGGYFGYKRYKEMEAIKVVQNGIPDLFGEEQFKEYKNVTYKDLYDSYFENMKWKYNEKDSGYIVTFEGDCNYAAEKTHTKIEMEYSEETERIEVNKIYLDGQKQSDKEYMLFFIDIFEKYMGKEITITGDGSVKLYDSQKAESNAQNDTQVVGEAPYLGVVYSFYSTGEETSYVLYDLDGDGDDDIIIEHGTCNADWTNDIYVYNSKTRDYTYIGEVSGMNSWCAAEHGKGVYAVWGRMGNENVQHVYVKDGKLEEDNVLRLEDMPDANCFQSDKWIQEYSANNLFPE